jgi:hypothetical protein
MCGLQGKPSAVGRICTHWKHMAFSHVFNGPKWVVQNLRISFSWSPTWPLKTFDMPGKEPYCPCKALYSPVIAPGIHKICEYRPILGNLLIKKQTRNCHMMLRIHGCFDTLLCSTNLAGTTHTYKPLLAIPSLHKAIA